MQSLFIWLHPKRPLVLWQMVDLNPQLDPVQKPRGLSSLCPSCIFSHDSPFLLSCVFCWRPKWPHSTLPTPIRVTLKQLSRGTTGHHHLPSHIYTPTSWQNFCPTFSPIFPVMFLAVISPFCILGLLLTSEAPLIQGGPDQWPTYIHFPCLIQFNSLVQLRIFSYASSSTLYSCQWLGGW